MSMFLAALLISAAPQATELDYAPGALAYGALVSGDLSRAERELKASQPANSQDPAWLINYGQLLAKSGRVNEAAAIFLRVAQAPDSEIVLASGQMMGSREASRRAMRGLRRESLSAR